MNKQLTTTISSLSIALMLLFTQSTFAFGHFGFHPGRHHLLGIHHQLGNHMGIPPIPPSENNFPEIKRQFQRMDNIVKMDEKIVDASPGILTAGALLRQKKQRQLQEDTE